uniref:non-specific serine/threonine protein kinase n=1 Tax=Oryza nivara TaxID=4536 RepID=A0A0E0FRH6_ORYNI
MAHLPLLLLSFLVLIGVHASVSYGSPPLPSTYDPSICSKSSECGGVNISYPFYLSNATDYYTRFSCGYTDLKISCSRDRDGRNETPTILLGGDNYTVLDIIYDSHTIVLADTDALRGGSCPRVGHNVTFGQAYEWLQYTGSPDNLTFFFGCKLNLAPPIDPGLVSVADQYQINCKTFSNGPNGGNSFVFTSGELEAPVESELARRCSQVIVVPVNGSILNSSNQSALPSGGYGQVLNKGFDLAWNSRKDDQCNKCEQSKGQCAYSQNRIFLGCLCADGKVSRTDCTSRSNPKIKIIAGVVGGGLSAVFALGLIATVFFVRKRKHKKVNSSSKLLKYSGSGGTPRSMGGDMESGSVKDLQTHLFSYEELEEATDSFNENRELGDGGFGTVYKGILRDGRVVAVKRLYNNSYRRVEQFVNEAAILSRLRHPNLVMFYGCTSSQSRELLLVYEFVANGTVADHLHGHRAQERALSWPLRLNIAVESAAALTYLHAIEPPIVHRDVKTTNILLDADFHVKVADFGLSRLFPLDVTHVSTAPQGTPGYVDPEYHQCYQLTDKSDVYSFGVVLVELISSKPAVDITRQRNEINLAGMAINRIQKSQLEELVDLELGYESDPATKKMMTMVAELAFRCLQQNGEMRPPIKEVLEGLKGVQDLCVMEKDGGKDKKGPDPPLSPDTVHAQWDSRQTTPNTSHYCYMNRAEDHIIYHQTKHLLLLNLSTSSELIRGFSGTSTDKAQDCSGHHQLATTREERSGWTHPDRNVADRLRLAAAMAADEALLQLVGALRCMDLWLVGSNTVLKVEYNK